jgi:hypothetical protein
MTQHDRILRHLYDYGTLSTLDAMREYGIMRLSARISELKDRGYKISSTLKKGKNRYGETTHYAIYKLEEMERKTDGKLEL